VTEESEGEVRERRAAVAELLARGLVRLTLQGRLGPQVPPSPHPEHSQHLEQKELVTFAPQSRHVSVGIDPKTLAEKGLRVSAPQEDLGIAKPTKGVTG